MEDLTRSMKDASLVPNAIQFGHRAARTVPASYKRNASFPGTKPHSEIYHSGKGRRSTVNDAEEEEDDDDDEEEEEEEEDGDDGEREDSLEGDEPQTGVRFAEEVAIRILSPIDRRQGQGPPKRDKRRGAPHAGHRGRRTGGVHSDDESRGRTRNTSLRDAKPGGAFRGRGRGGNRGRSSVERGFRGDGIAI